MPTYSARTTRTGMNGNPCWYSTQNRYYPTFGLPNCTCYAYGRWIELLGYTPSGLPGGDAGTWWNSTSYTKGAASTPKLGAILCMSGGPPGTSGRGHVAVVEQIYSDGSVLFSNSGYYRGNDPQKWNDFYFYLRCAHPSDNYQTGRHGYSGYGGYNIQGFIINPIDYDPDISPDPPPGPGPGPEPGKYPTRLILYKRAWMRSRGDLNDYV